jgi:repressor LexA
MMMARKREGLGDRHIKILEIMEDYQVNKGYPPTIREIGEEADISSTSVVNYYLKQLEDDGYIERKGKISRGLQIIKNAAGDLIDEVSSATGDFLRLPLAGRIGASIPVPMPTTDFDYFDAESAIEISSERIPSSIPREELFALEVDGDSMIDAMVADGDLVVLRKKGAASNGDMVAVWLTDKDETTLKYYFNEGSRVRLQPANPTMDPIYVNDPSTVEVQGEVVLIIRQPNKRKH